MIRVREVPLAVTLALEKNTFAASPAGLVENGNQGNELS